MTTNVTKESLIAKINALRVASHVGLSLNEEFQLAAYQELLRLQEAYAVLQEKCDRGGNSNW